MVATRRGMTPRTGSTRTSHLRSRQTRADQPVLPTGHSPGSLAWPRAAPPPPPAPPPPAPAVSHERDDHANRPVERDVHAKRRPEVTWRREPAGTRRTRPGRTART